MKLRVKLICALVFSLAQGAAHAVDVPVVPASGDVAAGKAKSAMCMACHGADGNSPSSAFPSIAGQGASYIAKQLQDYKSGKRVNALMVGMVAALSPEDMQNLGAFYASQSVTPQAPAAAEAQPLIEQGRVLYQTGRAANGATPAVAACSACHGATGYGNAPAVYPSLHAQHAAYTELMLKSFRDGTRSNDMNAIMRQAGQALTDDDIRALAAYTASMK
ncbi:MAG TPA: cytochrome c4 [bacterium]|mgnify:CR=1 FL=1|nr:cytochrome c4 [bacterium]